MSFFQALMSENTPDRVIHMPLSKNMRICEDYEAKIITVGSLAGEVTKHILLFLLWPFLSNIFIMNIYYF